MKTLTLPITLAAKLAAVAVHADELLSDDGHEFDRVALAQTCRDPEVVAWVQSLGPLAPQKRKGGA